MHKKCIHLVLVHENCVQENTIILYFAIKTLQKRHSYHLPFVRKRLNFFICREGQFWFRANLEMSRIRALFCYSETGLYEKFIFHRYPCKCCTEILHFKYMASFAHSSNYTYFGERTTLTLNI